MELVEQVRIIRTHAASLASFAGTCRAFRSSNDWIDDMEGSNPMARIVKRTPMEPKAYIIDGKEQWLCQCGLSQNQPFCDSSHELAIGEEPGKLYWYDDDDQRHEAAAELPGIRSF